MFTGIVQGVGTIACLKGNTALLNIGIVLPSDLTTNILPGASISVDGVCLTVVAQQQSTVFFDIIQETLKRSTLANLQVGQRVNIERALKIGDELGGHLLSGHIFGTATLTQTEQPTPEQKKLTFQCPAAWAKFLFQKGFIAINGTSLTISNCESNGVFSVCLIPETINRTNLGTLALNDKVNIEIDNQTQISVETIERYLEAKKNHA